MSGRIRLRSTPKTIAGILRDHRRIAVDSNILIYLLDGSGERAESAARLVDAIADGRIEGALATVGLSEILVSSARAGDRPAFERTGAVLRDLGFRIVVLDADTAEHAAWIRGGTGLAMPDAIHLACAIHVGATAFVTNDRRIRSIPNLDVIYLDDLVA